MSEKDEVALRRYLRNQEMLKVYMQRLWYAKPNDVIGGWCVMPVDEPPSCGMFEVVDFISQEAAEHIAMLHNAWLERPANVP